MTAKRRKTKPLPPASKLREWLIYNARSGNLRARKSISVSIRFYNTGKYVQVGIDGELYLAHRIIWKMVTGTDPIEVDHKRGKSNKWSNLRNATSLQNNRNRRLNSNNKSGVKGVCWEASRQKWRQPSVTHTQDRVYCGLLDSTVYERPKPLLLALAKSIMVNLRG